MWLDVIDQREFYKTPLGRQVCGIVASRLRAVWPDLRGQRLLGLGFATPYLSALSEGAERTLAVMPAGQGVIRWPDDGATRVCLAEEQALPLPDRSVDRLLIVHCLEGTSDVRHLLRECWRVLADGGRVLVVVANRNSLWARFEPSPFAHGRPFSRSQITKLLRDGMFVPLQTVRALFMPPMLWRVFGRWAAALDRVGGRWFPTLAGVHIIEAEKQIYAVPWDAAPAVAAKRASAVRPAAQR